MGQSNETSPPADEKTKAEDEVEDSLDDFSTRDPL